MEMGDEFGLPFISKGFSVPAFGISRSRSLSLLPPISLNLRFLSKQLHVFCNGNGRQVVKLPLSMFFFFQFNNYFI